MGGHGAIEVAKTVIEVAEVAWTAIESHHHHHDNSHHTINQEEAKSSILDDGLESIRQENQRLKSLLEQNLKLLHNLSQSPRFANDCPPDLYARLIATVESKNFLNQIEDMQQASANGNSDQFPFREATGEDCQSAEILINVDQEEPSWWVWVTDDMVPSNVEEMSGIDDENYVVVSEEHVVDGVANFMARCVISNTKAQRMTPEELQKSLVKALGGSGVRKVEKMMEVWHAGKMFYTLSTWGLTLAGIYRTRAVLKLAAVGVHTTGKLILKAL
ncbi:hypothetical protein SAY87_024428 [Trapa incisa]|uniref:Uncharacterized protein n=2 Tax=Trapa TaxID=22665 RepID=A0AAN7R1N6_TRANT|nr:hypothetical protein SAY87_024428 [Trapa incisa]KAK4788989.1 hypothetical protein SAY86_020308 [Trapa natans]